MARAAAPAPEESISPNIVPLLDVMFLLLIFLMLGSDMSVRDTAEVALPVASAAREQPQQAPERFLTVNVVHRDGAACAPHAAGLPCRDPGHWGYSVQGRDFDETSLGERLVAAAQDAREPADADGRSLSAVTLSIRSDRSAPFGYVQTALGACAAAGIHRTEVAAALPVER